VATVVDRIPTQRIRAQATQVNLGRLLLTVIAGLLFAVGWAAGRTVTGVVLAVLWSAAAVKVGYREARPRDPAR
jgi:hypothetical protein